MGYVYSELHLRRPRREIRQLRDRIFGKPGEIEGLSESRNPEEFQLRKLALEADFQEVLDLSPFLKEFIERVRVNVANAAWLSNQGQDDVLITNNKHNNDAERLQEIPSVG